MSDFPTIPELPDPPLRTDGRVDFARKGSAFLGFFPTLRNSFNAAGAWVESAMSTVLGDRQAAETARQGAESAASEANDHANDASSAAGAASSYAQVAAATANFVGEWSSLTGALSIPASVYHNGGYWQLLRDIPNVAASEPGMTGDWAGTETEIIAWTSISGNATLPPGHYRINFPGAPITLTLPASPANNDRIQLYRSSGDATGSVIARNGQTIMGLAENMTLDANMLGLDLIYNGSDWRVK